MWDAVGECSSRGQLSLLWFLLYLQRSTLLHGVGLRCPASQAERISTFVVTAAPSIGPGKSCRSHHRHTGEPHATRNPSHGDEHLRNVAHRFRPPVLWNMTAEEKQKPKPPSSDHVGVLTTSIYTYIHLEMILSLFRTTLSSAPESHTNHGGNPSLVSPADAEEGATRLGGLLDPRSGKK